MSNLICGCKKNLPVVAGERYCARCLVEKALSGGTVCLADLERAADERAKQEEQMWRDYEYEREFGDFRKALDDLGW